MDAVMAATGGRGGDRVLDAVGGPLFEPALKSLGEGDAVFIAQGEWHGVRNDSDRPVVTLVIYAGAGTLEEAGYEEHPRQYERD